VARCGGSTPKLTLPFKVSASRFSDIADRETQRLQLVALLSQDALNDGRIFNATVRRLDNNLNLPALPSITKRGTVGLYESLHPGQLRIYA
jgi:hypothetical protein